jgi:hypothetical protein
VWRGHGAAIANGRKIYACVERSWHASRQRDCRRGRTGGDDMSMMAPEYAGGEQVAVTVSKGRLEPEFLPQNWLRSRAGRQYVAASSALASAR